MAHSDRIMILEYARLREAGVRGKALEDQMAAFEKTHNDDLVGTSLCLDSTALRFFSSYQPLERQITEATVVEPLPTKTLSPTSSPESGSTRRSSTVYDPRKLSFLFYFIFVV
jgi:hypothetical protein